jgi:hypothetical protein
MKTERNEIRNQPTLMWLTVVITLSTHLPVTILSAQPQATQATVVTTFTPPYTIPLSDITSDQLRILVTAINGEITNGRVSVLVQGNNGIRLQNNINTSLFSLTIPASSPYQLTDGDLSQLLNRGNFTATGITVAQAFDQGLPPGQYEICFRVYVTSRATFVPISQQPPIGCAPFFILDSPIGVMVTTFVQPPPFVPVLQEYLYKVNSTLQSPQARNVRLFLTIKGDNGITIRSRQGQITPATIPLQAGVPYMLSSIDLDPYFRFENLTFSGISSNAVYSRGLPQGNYRFCVRVVDSNGTFISGDDPFGCSNLVSIKLFEPPQLIGPQCGTIIKTMAVQNIVFSWAPSPGTLPQTPYTLRIVEMLDPKKDPNDAMFAATAPAFFEETVVGTMSFLYGPAQPLLEPGRKYAWQVIAGIAAGLDFANSTSLFRNQGRSAVCSFTYEGGSQPLTLVTSLSAPATGPSYKGPPGNTSSPSAGFDPVYTFIYNSQVKGKLTYSFFLGQSQPLANANIKLVITYIEKQGTKLTVINDKYADGGKILATSKTDADGNFAFACTLKDSDLPKAIAFKSTTGTTRYKTMRIRVESPYILSPNTDIPAKKDNTHDVGTINAIVREYWMKVRLVSQYVAYDAIFKDAEVQQKLMNYDVYVLRQIRPFGVPKNEGIPPQPLEMKKGMEVIAKGVSNSKGEVQFYRMVKNVNQNDRYFLYAEGKEENLTNFKTDPKPFAFNFDKTPSQYKFKQYTGHASDNAVFWNEYVLPGIETELMMLSEPGEIIGYVKRGDNQNVAMSFAQVKLWELPKGAMPMFYILSNPPSHVRFSAINPKGRFKIDGLIPQAETAGGTLMVTGPKRHMTVSYTGFKTYKQSFEKILLGERIFLPNVPLHPKGSIIGEVRNEDNHYIGAQVSVPGGLSVQTILGGYQKQPGNMPGMYITHPTKSVFEVPAPYGNQKLTVLPNNQEQYLPYDTVIHVTKENQDAGIIKLYDKAYRIRVVVIEKSSSGSMQYAFALPGSTQTTPKQTPIAGAKVRLKYISDQPALTNSKGEADFKFKSMGNTFIIQVDPPEGKLYEATTLTLTKEDLPEPQKQYFTVTISLKKAAQISGAVRIGTSPIAGAKVFVKQSNTDGGVILLQTIADQDGKYILKNIPMNLTLEVWAVKGQSQYIGDVKNLTLTKANNENIDFVLTQYDNMVLTELLGIPIEVMTLEDHGESIKITGAFTNLPLPDHLALENPSATLPFTNAEIVKAEQKNDQGIYYGKPASGKVTLDLFQLDLKLNEKLVLHQQASESWLEIKDNGQGKGYLEAPTHLNISTFEVNSVDFGTNVLHLATGTGNDRKLLVQSISAEGTPANDKLYLVNEEGKDLAFKLYGFSTVASGDHSFIDGETLKFHSTLHTNLKYITTADLKLDIGNVMISKTSVGAIINRPAFDVPIDSWKMTMSEWSISTNGFVVHTGTLKAGVVDVPFTGLLIYPDKLHDNAKFNLSNMSLKGIVSLNVTGDVIVGYDEGYKMWSLKMVPKNQSYAAVMANLPILKTNQGFLLESVSLLSNGTTHIMMDKTAPAVTFYDLATFKATGIQVTNDAVSVVGTLDHHIAQLGTVSSGIVYTKQGNTVKGEVLPSPIVFTANAVKAAFSTEQQTFSPGKFEAVGSVSETGKFQFNVKLTHTNTSTVMEIIPGQSFTLAEGKKSELKNLAGKMQVNNKQWAELFFEGDLSGTAGATGRLGFTVKGDWVASKQQIGVQNVPSAFGGIALTYNFDLKRLEGNLHFDKQMSSSSHIKGDATVLVDATGWSFVSTGNLKMTNPNMEGQAGLVFGDYPMKPDIRQRFENTSYVYQKAGHLPEIFPTAIKGYYFQGGASMPVPLVPNFDFNFGLVSAHFYVNIGGDVRNKIEFSNSNVTIGMGTSIFVDAGLGIGGSVVVACAGCSAKLLAMMNFDGQISTGGSWFVDGEAFLKLTGTTYKGWGVCDSDCDGVLCDKSTKSASVEIGATGHFGSDYKEIKFYLK